MPGPIIKDPTPPWLKPQNASVLDPAWKKMIRAIVQYDPLDPVREQLPPLAGAFVPNFNPLGMVNDPQSQLLALMTPMGVPKAGRAAGVGAAAAKVVGKGKTAAAKAATPSFLAEVKALFPRLDKYTKAVPPVSAKVILKRVEAATNLSPEARTALTTVAETIGDRRVTPEELHALATGGTHAPKRVLRKVATVGEGQMQRPGAPLGVTTAQQERALRDRYVQGMAGGIIGRDWYTDSGKSALFHANDDPARARLLAEDLSITSPTTSVDANTGFGVKGYNQANAGVPVRAGRYPAEMSKKIEQTHQAGAGGATGLKRGAFSQNVARGGGFDVSNADPRPVHDIWDGEMHGFVNSDGTPMRQGFTPAQHAWMDRQAEKAIAKANAEGTGGFTDWDVLKSQAATWTDAKIRAGQVAPEDAAKSYADFFSKLYAQGSREVAPGRTTGHMPELLAPDNAPYLQDYHNQRMAGDGIYDAQGRDQVAAGFGGLVGKSFDGPGFYEGKVTPGRQTQVLTGTEEIKDVPGLAGARRLDEGSQRLMQASEATYGLLGAQDAAAFSRVLPSGSGVAKTAWDLILPGGDITPGQLQALVDRFGPRVADAAIVPIPGGVRLGNMEPALQKEVVQALGGRAVKVRESGALPADSYQSNNWQQQRVGQGYMPAIERMGPDRFDAVAPPIAQRLREIDAQFAKQTGGRFTLSPVIDEVRATIANEGWAGLQRLAAKYGIPVALLAASLQALEGSAPAAGNAPAENAGVQ